MSIILPNTLTQRNNNLDVKLQDHIRSGRVGSSYMPVQGKQTNESAEDYAQRLRESSLDYQFVAVKREALQRYVAFGASGPIVTEHGKFNYIPAEVVGGLWGIHHFLIYPDLETVRAQAEVYTRINSGCFSGMVLGDTTCDCEEQHRIAQRRCVEHGSGLVVEIPGQDGRGWGGLKMVNQRLMDELGVTTVEAARLVYGGDENVDQRTYDECAVILQALGFGNQQTFSLATNNPVKVKAFTDAGLHVTHTISVVAETSNSTVQKNISAKAKAWHHDLHRK